MNSQKTPIPLWEIFCEYFEEKQLCYKRVLLYVHEGQANDSYYKWYWWDVTWENQYSDIMSVFVFSVDTYGFVFERQPLESVAKCVHYWLHTTSPLIFQIWVRFSKLSEFFHRVSFLEDSYKPKNDDYKCKSWFNDFEYKHFSY